MHALESAWNSGGWVLLQNIHLTIDWTTGPLEKRVDKLADGAHPAFRWRASIELGLRPSRGRLEFVSCAQARWLPIGPKLKCC